VTRSAAAPAGQGAVRDGGSAPLLAASRVGTLSEPARSAWTTYLERSRRLAALDRSAMDAELRAAGLARMTRAPYARAAFALTPRMTAEWFESDSARRIADNVLSFQTPSGGWSKHVDLTLRPRRPGESYFAESDDWQYIATIDNGATTSQLRFLSRAYNGTGDHRYRDAVAKGLDYLLAAQLPNGCWPQVYPLQGGYHDAATFNDDATVKVLEVLREVGRGAQGELRFVPVAVADRARGALGLGVECLVASQVVVNGRPTAWGQQHDPITLAPVGARSYELVSLSGRESAGIVDFLMGLSSPDSQVVAAVHAAIDWFRTTAIYGYSYDVETGLRQQDGAGPIWARMSEIGTNRPIFSNRDGVRRYDWNELTDRRTGYAWYTDEPAGVLRKYERWSARHPRAATSRRGAAVPLSSRGGVAPLSSRGAQRRGTYHAAPVANHRWRTVGPSGLPGPRDDIVRVSGPSHTMLVRGVSA